MGPYHFFRNWWLIGLTSKLIVNETIQTKDMLESKKHQILFFMKRVWCLIGGKIFSEREIQIASLYLYVDA